MATGTVKADAGRGFAAGGFVENADVDPRVAVFENAKVDGAVIGGGGLLLH